LHPHHETRHEVTTTTLASTYCHRTKVWNYLGESAVWILLRLVPSTVEMSLVEPGRVGAKRLRDRTVAQIETVEYMSALRAGSGIRLQIFPTAEFRPKVACFFHHLPTLGVPYFRTGSHILLIVPAAFTGVILLFLFVAGLVLMLREQ